MGIVTTTSETAFTQSPEEIYDFVTNPANWTKTYPGSEHVGKVPEKLPLESATRGPKPARMDPHLHLASRDRDAPKLWVFNSVGNLGHDSDGNGGMPGPNHRAVPLHPARRRASRCSPAR